MTHRNRVVLRYTYKTGTVARESGVEHTSTITFGERFPVKTGDAAETSALREAVKLAPTCSKITMTRYHGDVGTTETLLDVHKNSKPSLPAQIKVRQLPLPLK